MGGLFIETLFRAPWHFISWVLIVTFSICLHEYAHARVALWRGDDTAATHGHLTLNPLVQMGPISLVALLVIGFAWGAVPVRTELFRRRSDAALVAFSGPAANLLLCILAALGLSLVSRFAPHGATGARTLFLMAAQANGVLFVLNMLPAPMLDGWAIYSLAAPVLEDWRRAYGSTLSWVAMILIFATPLSSLIWSAGQRLALFFTTAFSLALAFV